jgi:ELWxxDGT repeat protein
VSGTAYFSADDGMHGFELWSSDGTALGTSLVVDIRPGEKGSSPENLVYVAG